MMLKRFTAVVLTIAICLGMGVTAFALTPPAPTPAARFVIGSTTFQLNGVTTPVPDGVAPFIEGSRTMLPLNAVALALGATTSWDRETRTATIVRGDNSVNIAVDLPLPGGMGTATIVEGRTFVPIAFVAEQLGATTSWDRDSQAVYIFHRDTVAVLPGPDSYAPTPMPLPAEQYEYDDYVVYSEYDEDYTDNGYDGYDYADTNGYEDDAYLENGLSVYHLLERANAAIIEAGSLRMASESIMFIEAEGEVFEMHSVMIMDQVIRSETDMDLRMEMIGEVLGQTTNTVSYFRDGVFYMYVEELGDWLVMEMDLMDLIDQAGVVSFPENAITSEEVEGVAEGYQLTFIVDGAAMTTLFDEMMSTIAMLGIEEDFDMVMGDIPVVIFLDEDGLIRYMFMEMLIAVNVEGIEMIMAMEMATEVVQVGGISIDFPAELDEL